MRAGTETVGGTERNKEKRRSEGNKTQTSGEGGREGSRWLARTCRQNQQQHQTLVPRFQVRPEPARLSTAAAALPLLAQRRPDGAPVIALTLQAWQLATRPPRRHGAGGGRRGAGPFIASEMTPTGRTADALISCPHVRGARDSIRERVAGQEDLTRSGRVTHKMIFEVFWSTFCRLLFISLPWSHQK